MTQIVDKVREFTSNPQDLLSERDVAEFLQTEFGIAFDESLRIVEWLIEETYLCRQLVSYYQATADDLVIEQVVRHGPRFAEQPVG